MSLVGFSAKNHPQQNRKRGAKDSVDDRRTRPEVFDPLNSEFGPFDLDAAACADNTKCTTFYSRERSGLEHSWEGRIVWCNPPYSDIRPWVEKALAEVAIGCKRAVLLLPANRCEQRWWQDLIEPARDGGGAGGGFDSYAFLARQAPV